MLYARHFTGAVRDINKYNNKQLTLYLERGGTFNRITLRGED